MMHNKLIALPFNVDGKSIVIDTMVDGKVTRPIWSGTIDAMTAFDAPVAPGNISISATLNGAKVDEVVTGVRVCGKDEYYSDPAMIAVMGERHVYLKRWRIGGLVIELNVGMNRHSKVCTPEPVYTVKMTDVMTEETFYYAKVDACDLTTAVIPKEKERYVIGIIYTLERLSKQTGHSILLCVN